MKCYVLIGKFPIQILQGQWPGLGTKYHKEALVDLHVKNSDLHRAGEAVTMIMAENCSWGIKITDKRYLTLIAASPAGISCFKLTRETLEQGVKYVQS